MKTLLHFIVGTSFILFLPELNGQVNLLTEDFSGFTAGSHTTPSTSDVSANLDLKTIIPGWSGSMIYPAGGEVKIGTSSSTGWIETPLLFIPQGTGFLNIAFDISKWPNDQSTVRVYVNDVESGDILSPTDNFQTIRIDVAAPPSSCKVKIKGLTKRFFIDNLTLTANNISTGNRDVFSDDPEIKVYPVPADSYLSVSSLSECDRIEILGLSGVVLKVMIPCNENNMVIPVAGLNNGIYFIRIYSGKRVIIRKFIKSGND